MSAALPVHGNVGAGRPPMEGQDPPDYLNEHDKDGAFTHAHTHAHTHARVLPLSHTLGLVPSSNAHL